MQSYACHVNRQRVVVLVVGWLVGRLVGRLLASCSSSIWWMALVFRRRCHHFVYYTFFVFCFQVFRSFDKTRILIVRVCVCALHGTYIIIIWAQCSYNEHISSKCLWMWVCVLFIHTLFILHFVCLLVWCVFWFFHYATHTRAHVINAWQHGVFRHERVTEAAKTNI